MSIKARCVTPSHTKVHVMPRKKSQFLWDIQQYVSEGPLEIENQGLHISLDISLWSWKQVANPESQCNSASVGHTNGMYFERTKKKLIGENSEKMRALGDWVTFWRSWGITGIGFYFIPRASNASSVTGLESHGTWQWNILLLDWAMPPVDASEWSNWAIRTILRTSEC